MADGAPFLANPHREVAVVIAQAIAPPPPVDFNRWAVENVRFGAESPFPGPYNPDLFPYFSRPLEVLGPDHPTRVVVWQKSAQIGGTVLGQIFLGGSLDLDPCQFLYVHPTTDNAIRWVKTKWRAMIRQTTALKRLFPDSTSRDGTNSTLYQERADGRGSLLVSGGNSEASLSMISVARQIQDDLSKWEMNNAGDPEGQADSRSKAFEWAKIFKIGTPLIKGSCRISRNYTLSTQEHYHVPCPHCDHYHPLDWQNFLANIVEDDPESAFFTCPQCGGVIENHHLREMNRRGRWVADNPTASVVGFYIWAAYSPLESWKRIREAWLRAKGDPKSEQTFLNDTVGLPYEAAGESPPWEEIKQRSDKDGHKRGVIPAGALLLTYGFDCQSDRVECHVRGYGRDLKAYTVDYFVIDGHISETETMAKLDGLMHRLWPDSFGNKRPIDQAAIDGNAWTEEVFTWVRRHPASKLMMVRGISADQAPFLARVRRERTHKGDLKKYVKRFYNVGVSPLKMSLYKNLAKTDPLLRGFNAFPQGMEDDFYQQLCSERRTPTRKRDGSTEYHWTKEATQRNEVLDTAIYADAAAIRLGWRLMTDEQWDRLSALLEVAPPEQQADLEDLMQAPVSPAEAARKPDEAATDGWLARNRDRKWLSPRRT